MAHKKKIECTGRVPGTLIMMKGRSARSDKNYNLFVDCRCDCGKEFTARRHHLRADHTVSCGCVGKAKFKEYHQAFARKLSEGTVMSIWDEVNGVDTMLNRAAIGRRRKMTKYQIDYAVARGYEILKQRSESLREQVAERQRALIAIRAMHREFPAQPFSSPTERTLRSGMIFNLDAQIQNMREEKQEIAATMLRYQQMENEEWQSGQYWRARSCVIGRH